MKVSRIAKATLIALVALFLLAPLAAQTYYTSKAVAADEKALLAEKRPDFSSPAFVDKSVKVAGLPETLTWYTSKPPVMGSKRAKAGGVWSGYMAEYPTTFRTVGPNSNHAYRSLFLTNVGTININSETKEWIPGEATHWAFGADGKTVYYKLNPKVKWSDGAPVTSKDYLFMLEFMRSPHIQAPWYNNYYTETITDIKAYGDYVIAVTANVAMDKDDLLYNTSVGPRPAHFYGGTVPADFVEAYQWKAEPVTGPYKLLDYVKGETLTFQKVKGWWGHEYDYNKYRYNAEFLEYQVITGGNEIVKKYFYDGQIDQFFQIIPTEWAAGESAEAIKKGWIDRQYHFYVPLTGVSGIIMNTAFPLFADKNVRWGMYYAVNIQKMIDTELRGEYARYHNIGLAHVFGGIKFNAEDLRKPDFDPKKAGEFFDKAGYSLFDSDGIRKNAAGQRLSFELLYSSPNHTARLSILREEAKKAGLDMQLKLQQTGIFTSILEKNFQAWWGAMSTGLYGSYWQYFHSENAKPQTNNFWSYANPEMDKLLDAFEAEPSLAKKAELQQKIERMVHEEALVVPNYYVPFTRLASWKWVRYPAWLGQQFDDSWSDPINGGYFWIDEAIRKEVLAAKKSGQAYKPLLIKDETFKAK